MRGEQEGGALALCTRTESTRMHGANNKHECPSIFITQADISSLPLNLPSHSSSVPNVHRHIMVVVLIGMRQQVTSHVSVYASLVEGKQVAGVPEHFGVEVGRKGVAVWEGEGQGDGDEMGRER